MLIDVLLIDDDPALLTAFSDMISFHFPTIRMTAVDSGLAALGQLESQDYDLVICDLMMPGMDGVTTLAEIRKVRPRLCMYLMTGHPEPERAYKETEANGFIKKPLDRAYFLDLMERTIQVLSVTRRVVSSVRKARAVVSSADQQCLKVHRFLQDQRVIADVAASVPDSR